MLSSVRTERLILRKFTEHDVMAVYQIHSDKEVNRFLPWPVPSGIDEAYGILDRYRTGYSYAICMIEDDYPIGYVSIKMDESHDLGYGLRKEFWHQGIATEACSAIIHEAKENGLLYITATHDINNPRSGGVMKNIGMKYQYTYQEQWQPKNILVTFRMYQLNFDNASRVYRKYWDESSVHFIENDISSAR